MKELRDFESKPDSLTLYGFERREEHSTDSVRWVWYEKRIQSYESQICFVIQVEFELYISDNPTASYLDNRSYGFNGVNLGVIDRQMERWDSMSYEEDTESPRDVGSWKLSIQTLEQLESFVGMLGAKL